MHLKVNNYTDNAISVRPLTGPSLVSALLLSTSHFESHPQTWRCWLYSNYGDEKSQSVCVCMGVRVCARVHELASLHVCLCVSARVGGLMSGSCLVVGVCLCLSVLCVRAMGSSAYIWGRWTDLREIKITAGVMVWTPLNDCKTSFLYHRTNSDCQWFSPYTHIPHEYCDLRANVAAFHGDSFSRMDTLSTVEVDNHP